MQWKNLMTRTSGVDRARWSVLPIGVTMIVLAACQPSAQSNVSTASIESAGQDGHSEFPLENHPSPFNVREEIKKSLRTALQSCDLLPDHNAPTEVAADFSPWGPRTEKGLEFALSRLPTADSTLSDDPDAAPTGIKYEEVVTELGSKVNIAVNGCHYDAERQFFQTDQKYKDATAMSIDWLEMWHNSIYVGPIQELNDDVDECLKELGVDPTDSREMKAATYECRVKTDFFEKATPLAINEQRRLVEKHSEYLGRMRDMGMHMTMP